MPPSLRRLTSRIGAIVGGVTFTAPSDLATITALRDALNEHKALAFENVKLDNAGQERVAGWFGELTTSHPNVPATDGTTHVPAVDSETSKSNTWHTDVTFVASPPQVTTLRPIVCTPYEAEHPVVRVRPLTGEHGLFIGGFTQRIVGLSRTGSDGLLRIFRSYVTRPENILRWSWSADQLLVFDHRITQHYAIDNYDDHPRRLHRVTVAGDVPAGVDGRRSEQLVGDASHCTGGLEVAA